MRLREQIRRWAVRGEEAVEWQHMGTAELGKAEQYRHHAGECLRLARQTNDHTEKDLLLGMAEAWRRLAEHVRKTPSYDADSN